MSALRRMRATETPIAFKPWVYEIAKNACIDAFRRSKRAEEISYDADDGGDAPAPREQGPDARGRGRHAHVARPSARRLRRAVGGPPPDPRHARARGPELPPDRRAPGHEPPVGGVDALPRAPAPVRGVRGARLRRALPAHPVDHRAAPPAAASARATSARWRATSPTASRAGAPRSPPASTPPRCAPKRTVREKIAALLPLPAFLKRRLAGHGADDDGALASRRRPGGDAGSALDGRGQLRRPGRCRLGQGGGEGGRGRRSPASAPAWRRTTRALSARRAARRAPRARSVRQVAPPARRLGATR